MKRILAATAVAVSFAAGVFAGGAWWATRSGAVHASAKAVTVYSCPMHPEYRSDHPGNCPSCGMPLEADRAGAASDNKAAVPALPPGAVQVSTERQQAIGMRLGVVSRFAGTRRLRTSGRVAADENRSYPIVAALSGWIRDVGSVTTGDAVKKDQVLASFAAPDSREFESEQRSYYTSVEMLYRLQSAEPTGHDWRRSLEGIERMADGLRNMGVSNSQIREMGKRRELVHDIRVESPVDGFVLKRSVSPGLRFDRGFEFYRIADLSRVWVLADVYRDQAPLIRRGAAARLTTADNGRSLPATVSLAEPMFDESTLTLKVRLEAANPEWSLKPGMFVDVDFPVDHSPALVVPADAIVDTGLRKTVFVDRGNGYFEPRLVETGSRIDDDIEVTKGLVLGERIVVSGTFFVDSESRMKTTALEVAKP